MSNLHQIIKNQLIVKKLKIVFAVKILYIVYTELNFIR